MISLRKSLLLLTLLPGLAGCDTATSPTPSAPSPVPASPPPLALFADQTGFTTTDLRDAQEQIIQFSNSGDLIWTADGTRLPGYRVTSHPSVEGSRVYFISGTICPERCEFEVRFGAADGEPRAYLTVDYGHDNPGTIVDVDVAGGVLVVTQTAGYPPGTPTLHGRVFERTATGSTPLGDVRVSRALSSGWRQAMTDSSGFYEIHGLQDGTGTVHANKDGYHTEDRRVAVSGDTRFDIEMTVAQP